MNNDDKSRFLLIMTGIAEYYGKTLSQAVIRLYWEGLKQYDLQAVEKSLWTHTQDPDSGQFMPKIADVAKYLKGRTTDQAAIAWSKVDKAIRYIGIYQDVVFDDAIIHKVIADMGGWIALGSKTDEEWIFFGNQFQTRYRGYAMKAEEIEYQSALTGVINMQNMQQGFKLQTPTFVGDQLKARFVYEKGSETALLQMKKASESMLKISNELH